MREALVRREGSSLYTVEEWTGHEVAEWTFEDDGRIYFCGEDYASTMGKCTLRPLGAPRLRLDDVVRSVEKLSKGGKMSTVGEVARDLGRDVGEVEKSLGKLVLFGVIEEEGAGKFWKR